MTATGRPGRAGGRLLGQARGEEGGAACQSRPAGDPGMGQLGATERLAAPAAFG